MLALDDIYHKSKRGHATEKTEAGPHFDMCMSVIDVVVRNEQNWHIKRELEDCPGGGLCNGWNCEITRGTKLSHA